MNSRLQQALNHCRKLRRLRKQEAKLQLQGFVYLAQCGEFTKIGIADHVKRRIASLQTGNPLPIKLLRYVFSCDAVDLELRLHKQFQYWHVRGEWFKIPHDVLTTVINLPDSDLRSLPHPTDNEL